MRHVRKVFLAVTLSSGCAWGALTIQFDYQYDTGGFFTANPAAKTLLTTAASRFSTFTDSLTAISSGTDGSWTANFFNPSGTGGLSTSNLVVPANTLVVYVGAHDLGGALGVGGPGGWSAGGTSDFINNVAYRGQTGASTTPHTDFGPWGGAIAFDSTSSWYFGIGTQTNSQNDFLSVAEHELAHVLGFGLSNSWNDERSGTSFIGSTSQSLYGGPVPLDSGGGHWQEGLMSYLPGSGISQEVAMDPAILTGTTKDLTILDYAGLKDVGWQVPQSLLTVPEPASTTLALGVIVAQLTRRRRAA